MFGTTGTFQSELLGPFLFFYFLLDQTLIDLNQNTAVFSFMLCRLISCAAGEKDL